MRVIVYVEGPSDKTAMERLLDRIIQRKSDEGVSIEFFPSPAGDKKETLLTKVPVKAVNILRNEPDAVVIAVPDLYPKNKAFPHETVQEMEQGIIERFDAALRGKGVQDERVRERFKVFCFKHDMEVLLLAAEKQLRKRLGVSKLTPTWVNPAEDQDHGNPPKRVVEALFRDRNMKYVDTVDAPLILAGADYQDLAEKCDQCFKPFVEFLENCSSK